MGGKTTKLFKSPAQAGPARPPDEIDDSPRGRERSNRRDRRPPDETIVDKEAASPFVRYRRGSMYVDEDGDVAHEFYVETKEGTNLTLKQISNKNLTPQGDVLLDVPCLRNDYPVVMLDQNKIKE